MKTAVGDLVKTDTKLDNDKEARFLYPGLTR